jgi:hypothetical protein
MSDMSNTEFLTSEHAFNLLTRLGVPRIYCSSSYSNGCKFTRPVLRYITFPNLQIPTFHLHKASTHAIVGFRSTYTSDLWKGFVFMYALSDFSTNQNQVQQHLKQLRDNEQ